MTDSAVSRGAGRHRGPASLHAPVNPVSYRLVVGGRDEHPVSGPVADEVLELAAAEDHAVAGLVVQSDGQLREE